MSGFARQLGGELRKMSARRHIWLGFGVVVAAECLILLISSAGHAGQSGDLPLAYGTRLLGWLSPVLGTLFLAMVSGDIVSKEADDGTLAMALCRPASRFRILFVKYAACLAHTVALAVFMGASSLVAGWVRASFAGPAALTVSVFGFNPAQLDAERFTLAVACLGFASTSVTSLGLMFSCWKFKPGVAAVITITIVFTDQLIGRIPYFASLQPLLLSTRLSAWRECFAPAVPWPELRADGVVVAVFDALCLALALGIFNRRDFKV